MDEEETGEDRYKKVKENRVCPDCGQDVKPTTLGAYAAANDQKLEDGEDPEALAFMCSHAECGYMISAGEKPA